MFRLLRRGNVKRNVPAVETRKRWEDTEIPVPFRGLNRISGNGDATRTAVGFYDAGDYHPGAASNPFATDLGKTRTGRVLGDGDDMNTLLREHNLL